MLLVINFLEALQLLEYWHSFNLDRYYEVLKDHTFQTIFLDLSREEVKAWIDHNRGKVPEESKVIFARLEARLDEAIASWSSTGDKVVVGGSSQLG